MLSTCEQGGRLAQTVMPRDLRTTLTAMFNLEMCTPNAKLG